MVNHQDRLDRIRKVRSLNEVSEIFKSISGDVASHTREVSKLTDSTRRMVAKAAKDETLVINRSGRRPQRISTRSPRASGDYAESFNAFKAPPSTSIDKHMQIVDALYDNARELDAVEAMLRQSFAGAKAQPSVLKAIASLKKEVNARVHEALSSLNKLAEKHFPDEMKKLRDQLTSLLLDLVPEDQYEDIESIDYAAMNAEGNYELSAYLEIKDLKNNDGYVFEEYCVVLTGVVHPKSHRVTYYLNTMPDFRHPGSYALGKQINNAKEMEHQLRMMLAHNDVVSDLDRKPMPMDTKEAKAKGFKNIRGVGEVTVKDDALFLELNTAKSKSPAGQKAIVDQVIPLLNAASGRKKDTAITYTTVNRGGKKLLKFILVFRPGSGAKFNTSKLANAQQMLELDDRQMKDLRRFLKD